MRHGLSLVGRNFNEGGTQLEESEVEHCRSSEYMCKV